MASLRSNFDLLDDEFEHFLDSVLIEFKVSDLTREKREERRKRADASEFEFCKIYFPNIFHAPWSRLHWYLSKLEQGRYSVSGFRKSGKSAYVIIAKVIRAIAMRKKRLINLSLRTMPKAQSRTQNIQRLINRNQLLVYDYEIETQRDKIGEYLINEVMLYASSFETGLRSVYTEDFKRIDLSVNDDLYDYTTIESEKDNEAVYQFIIGEIYGAMEDNGLSITLGNRIHENCPIEKLKQANPKNHFSFPARDEEGKSNWPEQYTEGYWSQKESETDPKIWDGDCMDRPPTKGDVFDKAWDCYVNINTLQIVASVTAVDPSYGASPQACRKAAASVSITAKKQVILTDMYLRNESYIRLFDYLDALIPNLQKFRAILFENDFNQWGIAAPYYDDWMQEHDKTLPIVFHFSSQLKGDHNAADKDSRIMLLVHPIQTKILVFSEEIKGHRDFKSLLAEKAAYNGKMKTKLDGLDALATAFIMCRRYVETGSFKSLKQRMFPREKTWWRKA